MPSPEILDFGAMLEAIPGDNPGGASVRYVGIYDSIQDARREEDVLPMGEWQREVKTADWNAVIELCTKTIATKSKDLQIAAWLAEGLVKRYGFSGLRDGLRLLYELQEKFWDGLFPEAENGDIEFRAGPLDWLNQKLPGAIKAVTLTQGERPYCWFQWEESRTIDNLARKDPAAMEAAKAENKITGEQFEKAVETTPRSFYEVLFEDLNDSKETLRKLETMVDERFGRDAPSLIAVRNSIEDCFTLVNGVLKKKRQQDPSYRPEFESLPDDSSNQPGGTEANSVATSATMSWSGEPKNREEAFRQLAVIAAYLKRVEPQHPVSYLLERAVRWTKMPLEEWLGEVVRNEDVLNHLRETLGIKAEQNS
jgi:type VI secretion system protein ImpA